MYSIPRRDGSPGGTPNRIKSFVFISLMLSLYLIECCFCVALRRLLSTTSESNSLEPARPSRLRDSFEFAHPTPAIVDERLALETQIPPDERVHKHKSKAPGRG